MPAPQGHVSIQSVGIHRALKYAWRTVRIQALMVLSMLVVLLGECYVYDICMYVYAQLCLV